MRAILIQRHGIELGESLTKWEKTQIKQAKKPSCFYDYAEKRDVKYKIATTKKKKNDK